MSEWSNVTFKDIADFNPRESVKKGEVAVKVGMDKLQPFCRDISEIEYQEFSGGTKFRNGDTIMARITPCLENGKTAMVNVLEEGQVGFGSTEYIVFRSKKGITDPYFLYYLVCSPTVREPAIKSMVGSSGRQRVQIDVVQNLELKIPSLTEQKKIGDFLRKLDDKIAINNKINRNLEQQLKCYFSHISEKATKIHFISDFCDLGSSKRVFARDYKLSGIPFYRGKEISLKSNGQAPSDLLYISAEHYAQLKEQSGVPQDGDILITAVGTIGNSYMVHKEEFYFKDGNIIWLKNFTSQEINYYIFDYMQSLQFKNDLAAITIGSTQQALTIVSLSKMKIQVPSSEYLNEYYNFSKMIHDSIVANQAENVRLIEIRDSLLPKLMSGELDVSDLNV